jgi:hypothetical protein
MLSKRKLQVFVSSTYTDLQVERQAAVEAILTAGHIPAGMELFAAGDQSQMDVIKRWIDESDVFLLILGGRYGSLDPNSKKSYIELEYEYAHQREKPSFAVVITEEHLEEKVRAYGRGVIETEWPQQLKVFRQTVLSRVSRFWSDPRDIKIAVLETLSEISRRDDLIGWIPGDQAVNSGALAEEIARLGKENAILRDHISKMAEPTGTFTGLSFDEMLELLREEKVDFRMLKPGATEFKDAQTDLLEVLWNNQATLQKGAGHNAPLSPFFERLSQYGLVTLHPTVGYALTDDGKRFLLRLRVPRTPGSS